MELRELIRETRQALTHGEDALAAAAARHMLYAFPSSLTAHQMLGESLIEQGELDGALEHFSEVISIDPLNSVARLGLGVIAEERQDLAGAYAAYLSAWELHPEMDHLRDELIRVQESLGRRQRLHPTRTGLAMTYIQGGEPDRAATELRAVMKADPEDTGARLMLAALLWRIGDDDEAAAACRALLDRLPNCARALAMLAEIKKRQDRATPDEIVERVRALDPAGDLIAELNHSVAGGDHDLGFLLTGAAELPDFTMQPAAAGPASEGEGAESMTRSSDNANADPWDSVLRELSGETATTEAADDDVLQPFSWTDEPSPDEISVGFTDDQLEAARPGPGNLPRQAPPDPAGLPAGLEDLDLEPFRFEDVVADDEHGNAPVAAQDWGIDDVSTASAETPSAPTSHPIDLTAGWDDLDRALADATPPAQATTEYDDLLAGLDMQGITPLDPGDLAGEQEWTPRSAEEWEADIAGELVSSGSVTAANDHTALTDDDPVTPLAASGQPGDSPDEVEGDDAAVAMLNLLPGQDREEQEDASSADERANAALSDAWGDVDETVSSGPAGLHGYTEILRGLEAEFTDSAPSNDWNEEIPGDSHAATSDTSELSFGDSPHDEALFPDIPILSTSFVSGESEDAVVEPTGVIPLQSSEETMTEWSQAEAEAQSERVETSQWPRFAPCLAGLSDSAGSDFKLFARLREEKRSLIELGVIDVDGHVSVPTSDGGGGYPDDEADQSSQPIELDRETLRRFRRALDRRADARGGVLEQLEDMASAGRAGAAVHRLLGEAYLRSGRTGEAAQQFRSAFQQHGQM